MRTIIHLSSTIFTLVSVPRQIEIFRFSYFIHVEEMLEKLLSVIVDRSLTETFFYFDIIWKLLRLFARADLIEEICEKLLVLLMASVILMMNSF